MYSPVVWHFSGKSVGDPPLPGLCKIKKIYDINIQDHNSLTQIYLENYRWQTRRVSCLSWWAVFKEHSVAEPFIGCLMIGKSPSKSRKIGQNPKRGSYQKIKMVFVVASLDVRHWEVRASQRGRLARHQLIVTGCHILCLRHNTSVTGALYGRADSLCH